MWLDNCLASSIREVLFCKLAIVGGGVGGWGRLWGPRPVILATLLLRPLWFGANRSSSVIFACNLISDFLFTPFPTKEPVSRLQNDHFTRCIHCYPWIDLIKTFHCKTFREMILFLPKVMEEKGLSSENSVFHHLNTCTPQDDEFLYSLYLSSC